MKLNYYQVVFWTIIIACLINIGNYSFLSFSFSGRVVSNPLFQAIIYSRLLFVILAIAVGVVGLSNTQRRRIANFYIKNIDVLIFVMLPIAGVLNYAVSLEGLIYFLWNFCSYTLVVFFIFYLKYQNEESEENLVITPALYTFAKLLFISSFIVIPFLCIKIPETLQTGFQTMAFSSRQAFPYVLLSLVLSCYIFIIVKSRASSSMLREIGLSIYLTRNNLFYWGILFLSFFFLIASGRRGPMLVVVLASPVFFYYIFKNSGKKLKQVFISGTILALVALLFAPQVASVKLDQFETVNRLKKLSFDIDKGIQEDKSTSSYASRLQIWESYFPIVRDYPLFGVGLSNGAIEHEKRYANWYLRGYSTHNNYLGIWVEQGVIGLMLYIFIILRSIVLLLGQSNLLIKSIFLAAIFQVLIINWNEYNVLSGQIFFWHSSLVLMYPRIYI